LEIAVNDRLVNEFDAGAQPLSDSEGGEIVWDAETGSAVKLGRGGTNIPVYMKHPSTRLWLFAYSHNGAPPQIWKPSDPVPEAFRNCGRFICHNVEFERAVWRHILIPQYGFPPLPPSESWFCTQAAARMTALPGALENAANILQLPYRKHDDTIMKRMMKPRPSRRGDDTIRWFDSPADIAALGEYCIGDVLCEMALYHWILRHWGMSRLNSKSSDTSMKSADHSSTASCSI
jgi:hypothetical protein